MRWIRRKILIYRTAESTVLDQNGRLIESRMFSPLEVLVLNRWTLTNQQVSSTLSNWRVWIPNFGKGMIETKWHLSTGQSVFSENFSPVGLAR